jgi:hypothetical protein
MIGMEYSHVVLKFNDRNVTIPYKYMIGRLHIPDRVIFKNRSYIIQGEGDHYIEGKHVLSLMLSTPEFYRSTANPMNEHRQLFLVHNLDRILSDQSVSLATTGQS